MTDFAGTFDHHEIRDRVIAPHFGSWRLMRRTESSRWTGVFWCRITAADGLLRVSGDFDPIVFQGHLSHEDDPASRVAWMGARKGVDCYVREKASTGTGGASYSWDTEDARADLQGLIADREKELAEEREQEDEDTHEVTRLSRDIEAFKRGAEWCVQYSGEPGCVEIMEAVFDYEPDPVSDGSVYVRQHHEIESEVVCTIGRRPSNGLKLAHRAVRRLHLLLEAEGTPAWSPGDVIIGAREGQLNEWMLRVLYVGDGALLRLLAIHEGCDGSTAWRAPRGGGGEGEQVYWTFTPPSSGTVRHGRKWRRASGRELSAAKTEAGVVDA